MSASPQIAYTAPKSVSISEFKRFSASSIARLTAEGMEADAAKELWLDKARWVCTRCGSRLDPDGLREVFDLKGQTKPTLASAKSILKGVCSKEGCDSGFVWLKLESCPEVDWARLFEEGVDVEADHESVEEVDAGPESTSLATPTLEPAPWRWWGSRILIGVALIALLFTIARELGLGSRVRSLTVDTEEFKGSSETDYLGSAGE